MTQLKQRDDYLALFLNNIPLIDTRAPVEYAKGSFPGAVNLPLMSDEERTRVGTCYKQQGQAAAIELGHALVNGRIKAERVDAWLAFARKHPQGALFCWRGGLRSQISQQWLHEAGCDYPKVTGGYKALRRFLLDELTQICRHTPLVILGGHTGCAKTELLRHVDNSVDLEGLAHHRGSAFGKRVSPQPSQLSFENALAIALLRARHAKPGAPIVLEDESRLIGRVALPPELQEAMKDAPVVLLQSTLEQRVEHTFENYILQNLRDWQQRLDGEQAFAAFSEQLREGLKNIRRRLGGLRYAEIASILEEALHAHQGGDNRFHRKWITLLLRDYYDPMYQYQLTKQTRTVLFSGDAQEVTAFLNGLSC